MIHLRNECLDVAVLDPVADRERFGTRYCTGGYIFQVTDARRGPLLSGPTYPDSFNTFDGQGLPEAFNRNPLSDPAMRGAEALIPGIGVCDLVADTVTAWCRWDVEPSEDAVRMRTEQAFQRFSLVLERTVTLHDRTVRSATRVRNAGSEALPIRWFPHPFFPQPETAELCRFNVPVRFPDNPGFTMAGNGYVCRKPGEWTPGHYQALDHDARTNLVVLQRHPVLGLVGATCSYVPAFFPIWGNARTFSWEPYVERSVAPGQETSWWIDYDF